jgi:hypothetical protein
MTLFGDNCGHASRVPRLGYRFIMWRRPTRTQVSAAAWAVHVRFQIGRQLHKVSVEHLERPAAPRLGLDATRGVRVALLMTKATCLERSLVYQSWFAAHGIDRDVVIGVTSPKPGFRAHAWLEEPGQLTELDYTAITRLPARVGVLTREGDEMASLGSGDQSGMPDHATDPAESQPVRLRGTGLEFVEVEGELVVLDSQRSMYFSVNGAGSPLWAALREGASEHDLQQVLIDAYRLPKERAAADVTAFLGQLRTQGLLDGVSPSS